MCTINCNGYVCNGKRGRGKGRLIVNQVGRPTSHCRRDCLNDTARPGDSISDKTIERATVSRLELLYICKLGLYSSSSTPSSNYQPTQTHLWATILFLLRLKTTHSLRNWVHPVPKQISSSSSLERPAYPSQQELDISAAIRIKHLQFFLSLGLDKGNCFRQSHWIKRHYYERKGVHTVPKFTIYS